MRRALSVSAFSLLATLILLGWAVNPPQASAATRRCVVAPATYVTPSHVVCGKPVATHPVRHVYYTRSYVKPRSKKRSVAITAGSAGFGAAVGALAGGGHGAAIGALAGGGAGFVYDRLTHRHPPQ